MHYVLGHSAGCWYGFSPLLPGLPPVRKTLAWVEKYLRIYPFFLLFIVTLMLRRRYNSGEHRVVTFCERVLDVRGAPTWRSCQWIQRSLAEVGESKNLLPVGLQRIRNTFKYHLHLEVKARSHCTVVFDSQLQQPFLVGLPQNFHNSGCFF